MSTRLEWADLLTGSVGGAVNDQTRLAWVTVFVAEGSNAEDNPADSTEAEPGATPYNTFDGSLHVWNYPSVDEGVAAVKAILEQPNNGRVVIALKQGTSAASILSALTTNGASWESAGALYLDTLPRVEADYTALAAVEVAGSSPSPAPASPPPPTEEEKVESAIDAQVAEVKADEAEPSVPKAKVAALVAELKTHLAELEDLTK